VDEVVPLLPIAVRRERTADSEDTRALT